jgi:hypothetical protein
MFRSLFQRVRAAVLCLPLILLNGCLDSTDELAIEPDGSGKVRLQVLTSVPAELLEHFGEMGPNSTPFFPPLSADLAAKFFPETTFITTVKEEPRDGARLLTVDASFKNLQDLIQSPYGRAHALSLEIRDGKLLLKANTGLESAARLAETKNPGQLIGNEFAGLADLQKKAAEMRVEFRIKLPRPVDSSTGTHADRLVTWKVGRTAFTNSQQFAEKLGEVLAASCPAGDLPALASPPRLELQQFSQLQEQTVSSTGGAPDAKQVTSAARFVPHVLQVTRTMELTGETSFDGNQANLSGALTLPKELTPSRWGEVKIEEIVDATGMNLKLPPDQVRQYGSMSHMGREETGDPSAGPPGLTQKAISIQFRPPEWSVKEITRIRASIEAHYAGTSRRILKFTNAVPANSLQDVSRMETSGFPENAKPVTFAHPGLAEMGYSLTLTMGYIQPGYTMLALNLAGGASGLNDVLIYDASGRPWPTYSREDGGEERSCQLMIPGQPQPPLSMAIILNASGGGVRVPIVLDKVPID